MNLIVTAGPTREHIDPVRFITNASSGKMGYAVAAQAARDGHHVTLLSGPVGLATPPGARRVDFVTVADLKRLLGEMFPSCDALVMSAAVGDFTVENISAVKIRRKSGPVNLRLIPTEDVIASVSRTKRPGQIVIAFAVESGPPDAAQGKAAHEMSAKGADFVVVNLPEAIAADVSQAAILSPQGIVLPWAGRSKDELAKAIVGLLKR